MMELIQRLIEVLCDQDFRMVVRRRRPEGLGSNHLIVKGLTKGEEVRSFATDMRCHVTDTNQPETQGRKPQCSPSGHPPSIYALQSPLTHQTTGIIPNHVQED